MLATETEPPVKRSVPAWRRLVVAAGWFALVLIAVSTAGYFYDRYRVAAQVDRMVKELDEADPGWTWEGIRAAYRERKDKEDSDAQGVAILRDLPPGWPDPKKQQEFVALAPNRVLDGPRRELLDELLAVPPVPALRERARGLVRSPLGRIDLPDIDGPNMPEMKAFQPLNPMGQLLSLDALALSLSGRHGEALQAARACLYASRVPEDWPFEDGFFTRLYLAALSIEAVERTMALGDAPDAALAAYQDALRLEAGRTGLVTLMRGKRAFLHRALELIGTGKVKLDSDASLVDPSWERWGLTWYAVRAARERLRREHVEILRVMTRVVDLATLPTKDQFAAEDAIERHVNSLPGGSITGRVFGQERWLFAAARTHQGQAVAMRALIAVERYRLKHGKWPARLEDTVPAFLDKVPEDPIDGNPIRYRKWADGVMVYSIGNDRTDDGGDLSPLKKIGLPSYRAKDIGCRLWDKEKRRAAPP